MIDNTTVVLSHRRMRNEDHETGIVCSQKRPRNKQVLPVACALFVLLCTAGTALSEEEHQCRVYLAKSTIPDSGFGMFAGKRFSDQEEVTTGDVVIPLIDIDWHNDHEDFLWLFDQYHWLYTDFGGVLRMDTEDAGQEFLGFSPGLGAALNCLRSLVNVDDTLAVSDSAGMHRLRDPGAGAFTPYHSRRGIATRDIEPGAELFIDYGQDYFETRKSYYSSEDYSPEAQDEQALYNRSIRSVKWLQENGQCMDNIVAGRSQIPQAGRGAFAARFIPKGGLVGPAPLLHVTDKDRLTMYKAETSEDHDEDGLARNASAPFHTQLLRNYCFGHADSTLLLCPYGLVTALVNHSHENPNAKIQWSKKLLNPEWLDMPVGHMEEQKHSGLSFDFVALRDIQPGEEILMDYGTEWEEAWQQHVANWKPPRDSNKYISASELNQDVDLEVRVLGDQLGAYVDVEQYCYETYRLLSGLQPSEYDFHFCRAVDRFRVTDETMYMVEIVQYEDDGDMTFLEVKEVMFAVPRDAFVWDNVPKTRDFEMPWSFRHEIMIPDDMFPKAWKNNV